MYTNTYKCTHAYTQTGTHTSSQAQTHTHKNRTKSNASTYNYTRISMSTFSSVSLVLLCPRCHLEDDEVDGVVPTFLIPTPAAPSVASTWSMTTRFCTLAPSTPRSGITTWSSSSSGSWGAPSVVGAVLGSCNQIKRH